MQTSKIKSFTLSELLVVMIITAIVVGLAFSVLGLVRNQIYTIEKNYSKTTELALLEQVLCQDFNTCNTAKFDNGMLILISDIDTIRYSFQPEYLLRNQDTINLKLKIDRRYYCGKQVRSAYIDAI